MWAGGMGGEAVCGGLWWRVEYCAQHPRDFSTYQPRRAGSHKILHVRSKHQSCDVSDGLDRLLFNRPPKSMSGGNRRNILDSQENTYLFWLHCVCVVHWGSRDWREPSDGKPCWPPWGIWQLKQTSDMILEWKQETMKNELSNSSELGSDVMDGLEWQWAPRHRNGEWGTPSQGWCRGKWSFRRDGEQDDSENPPTSDILPGLRPSPPTPHLQPGSLQQHHQMDSPPQNALCKPACSLSVIQILPTHSSALDNKLLQGRNEWLTE